MTVKPQIRSGRAITLIQLIISVIVVLVGGIGLYVKNQISITQMQDRLTVIEKAQAQWQGNSLIKQESRNAEIKVLNDQVNKNQNDINILQLQFQQIKK